MSCSVGPRRANLGSPGLHGSSDRPQPCSYRLGPFCVSWLHMIGRGGYYGLVTKDMDRPYCSTCRTPLTVYANAAGEVVLMEHAREGYDDHTPVPVPLSDIVNPLQYCDFCSTEGPQWMFSTSETIVVEATKGRIDDLGVTWLACDTCFILIENKNLEGLLTRVIDTYPHGPLDPATATNYRSLMEPIYVRLFEEMGEVQLNPKGPQ